MPLGSKDSPTSKAADAEATPDAPDPGNPHASQDPAHPEYQDVDPAKVVGTYAMQPDPNADRPAPTPVVPPGVKKAPADDAPNAPAIGGNGESK